MDKANIIISIIVVLCIAAAVAAYGITNSDSPIFSDLSSMSSSDDAGNGIGNISSLNNGTGSSVATTSSNSGSSGSSSSGSSSGSGSGSGSSSGSGSGSGGSSHGGSGTSTHLSYSQAQSIANGAIEQAGCYAGNGRYSNGYWIFTIYDANGNNVDSIGVNDATGMTERM
ncbi:MAG: endoglucanase [Methanobrevibacter sp.]|nr:endoglucanase [Methanobrevibacter sp.]MBR1611067.1 endoglucanase [Methanobrevibacter sp.]